MHSYTGTGVAVVTPRFNNGRISPLHFVKHVKRLLEHDISMLVVLGTTGEATFANRDEREHLTTLARKAIDDSDRAGSVVLGVGTGTDTLEETIALTKQAYNLGADFALVRPAAYVKPSQEAIVDRFRKLAKAVPKIYIMGYNVPSRTGVAIAPYSVGEIFECSERVRSFKEASGQLGTIHAYAEVAKELGRTILSGDDKSAYHSTSRLGASGGICVVGNLIPGPFSELMNIALEGGSEEGEELNSLLQRTYELSMKFGNPVSIKGMMKAAGYQVGPAHVELGALTQSQQDELASEVRFLREHRIL